MYLLRSSIILFLGCIFLYATGKTLPLHNQSDNIKVQDIILSLKEQPEELGTRMASAARMLVGAGEDDFFSADSIGALRINLDSFTPLMFVNNVVALAKTSLRPGTADISIFSDEFQNIACRRGEYTGFPSIMYHGADWIGDNSARGNLTELTENYNGSMAKTKSLDEMTRFRNNFAALADSATFEAVRMTEMGYRTHRIPFLKKETIKKKEITDDLRDGDIILLVPNRDGIDIYDMGIVSFQNGTPHLIHLSPSSHTVIMETDDLARYLSLMTKYFQGYRILRAKE